MRDLKKDYYDLEDAMATAAGAAERAVEGNRDALRIWAALISQYLRGHLVPEYEPTQHGFPTHYDDADARLALLLMAEALERIHNGDEPNRVFGWNTGRRGRPEKVKSNPRRASEDVFRLEMIEAHIASGETALDACKRVAVEYGDSSQRLYQLYKRNR